MASEENEEKKPEAEAPKKKSKLPLIIGVVVALALIGGGVGFFLMKGEKKDAKEEVSSDAAMDTEGLESESAIDPEEALEEGEEPLGAIFPLETFVVNLNGGRYVRIQMQVEFVSREVPKRFTNRIPVIRDGIIAALNKLSAEKVLAENGKDSIKSQAKDVINEAMRKEEVKKIYFTQFIVQ
jgi:flagellar FliL protein